MVYFRNYSQKVRLILPNKTLKMFVQLFRDTEWFAFFDKNGLHNRHITKLIFIVINFLLPNTF